MTTDLLQLRIVRIEPEIGTLSHADACSYFLEALSSQPVHYQAGQFLTLILNHNGHELRRSYSLSSAPGVDSLLRLTIKRVVNGEISRYLLDTLRVGDVLISLPPAGRFILNDELEGDSTPGKSSRNNVVLIGAGSGITALFGILKQVLYTRPDRRVTLLYSNTRERSIIFRQELDALQRQFTDRFRLIHILSNPTDNGPALGGTVRVGRLNNVMLEQLLPDLINSSGQHAQQFFVCGPGDYMRMVQFTLVFSGIRPDQIRREDFVIKPVTLIPQSAHAVDRTVLLRHRGREVEITVPAYKSILQAALDEGIRLPYSCRGGRCSTCIARCTTGRVQMIINDVLTERDLAEGWILTCTAFPESDGVIIDIS